MKNQYFGDISDYKKYGLLRILSNQGAVKITVCWMLTEDDGKTDGKFLEYLQKPDKWRRNDPQLFDKLVNLVIRENKRDVNLVGRENLISCAVYHSDILTDDATQREQYFEKLGQKAIGSHLIFLDPDNGIEVKSVTKGSKNSCKYLYWNELSRLYGQGFSLLAYQHFSRVKRRSFIRSMALEMMHRTETAEIFSFQTSHVVFFLIPQPDHKARLGAFENNINKQWNPHIRTIKHTRKTQKNLSDSQLSLKFP